MPEIDIEQNIPQINIDTATRSYHLPIASETTLGGIKVGTNLSIEEDGTLNAESPEYQLPTASVTTLGGIKVGAALTINHGVLSVEADQSLDSSSVNPVRNSVLATTIGNLSDDLSAVSTTVTGLSNNYTTLNTTVGGHTTSIENLDTAVTNLGLTVDDHTTSIETNTSSIGDLSTALDALDDRVDTAEGDITTINNSVSDLSSDVTLLKYQTSETITNSYLLPVSTWSSGDITIDRRGKVATITFNLGCTLTLHNTDVTVYTLTENVPNADTFGVLLTDAGSILCKIDTDGIITLMNPEGDNKTITTVQGQLTLVFQ